MIKECTCSGCTETEKKSKLNTIYVRKQASVPSGLFQLLIMILFLIVSALIIGKSFSAIIPFISFAVAYVVNSFVFCSSCTYHHAGVKYCGCFPKSVFSFKREKAWGAIDNILGWPLILGLLCGPTMLFLIYNNTYVSLALYTALLLLMLFSNSVFSCPNCRQRGVCALGKATIAIRKKQGYL